MTVTGAEGGGGVGRGEGIIFMLFRSMKVPLTCRSEWLKYIYAQVKKSDGLDVFRLGFYCVSGRHRSVLFSQIARFLLEESGRHVTPSTYHTCKFWWGRVDCQRDNKVGVFLALPFLTFKSQSF